MKRYLATFPLLAVLLVCAAFGQSATVKRADVLGGMLSDPVAHGKYLYVGTGVTLTVWDMVDPTHPVLAGRTKRYPEQGPIMALALVVNDIYVGWNNGTTSGITIYSLDDPVNPRPVARLDNYSKSTLQKLVGLASGKRYVYVGDANNGLIVLDANNPIAPKNVGDLSGIYEFDAMAVYGNKLLTSGTNWIGDRVVHVIDISDPAGPVEIGSKALDGMTVLRVALTPGYAIGVGLHLQVYNLRSPSNIIQVFDLPISPATNAIRLGSVLYLAGATGIQVWDFTKPAAPKLLRTVAMDTFATDRASNTAFGPVILTHTDIGFVLGVSDPLHPVLGGKFMIPFGVSAHAGGFDAKHMYVAEEAYGLAVLDTKKLARDGRYDAALPPDLAQRDMENVSIDGGRAYLAAWGYGVLIVDLSKPAHPTELGRFAFPFATAIKAAGDLVYVASVTDQGIFEILDVSNPNDPVELGSMATDQTLDLTVRGHYAYLAGRTSSGPGGLSLVDVSNPSAPLKVGQYTSCPNAYGVDVSADGNTAYLACVDGSLDIIDTSNKTSPTLLGSVKLPGNVTPQVYAVIVSGTAAYVGNDYGVDEVDVSNPKRPVRTVRHKSGFPVRRLALAPDGRIFAFAGLAGTYEFAPVTDSSEF
jgi:hypothetical protein